MNNSSFQGVKLLRARYIIYIRAAQRKRRKLERELRTRPFVSRNALEIGASAFNFRHFPTPSPSVSHSPFSSSRCIHDCSTSGHITHSDYPSNIIVSRIPVLRRRFLDSSRAPSRSIVS